MTRLQRKQFSEFVCLSSTSVAFPKVVNFKLVFVPKGNGPGNYSSLSLFPPSIANIHFLRKKVGETLDRARLEWFRKKLIGALMGHAIHRWKALTLLNPTMSEFTCVTLVNSHGGWVM